MRQSIAKLMLLLSGTAALVGCGVPGIPKPPSLDLPQPVTDLRAVRKGDHVHLDWTVPTETTDRLAVRHPGPTRICRSLDAAISECANPVGEVPAPQLPGTGPRQTKSAKTSATMHANYTDGLPRTLLVENSGVRIFYAVSVLNSKGRTAGISNVVSVPAIPALPPPSDFRAQVAAGRCDLELDQDSTCGPRLRGCDTFIACIVARKAEIRTRSWEKYRWTHHPPRSLWITASSGSKPTSIV